MADLITATSMLTMTSRDIAELTGKDHDNVRRDIKNLAAELSLSFEEKAEVSSGGRPSKVFTLGKRETLILVSGYSVQMRARIIDRWQELEAKAVAPALPDFTDPAAAAIAWAEQFRAKQAAEAAALQLEQQVQEQAPKVRFAEAVGDAPDLQKTAQVAKALGIGPRKLLQFLKISGVLMRNGLPYQQHIERGRFRVVEVPYKDRAGDDHIRPETRVTGKGVTFLQQALAKNAPAGSLLS